ncbi:hypothetical protein Tco_0558754 [Tanacetum coccineum]
MDNEDLEQIDTDDLEEMDLKWQVAMLTMRVKRFLKKTGRNLNFNGKELLTRALIKTKLNVTTATMRGHFARECRAARNQGNRNGDALKKIVPVETPANALVVQDGIGSSVSSSSNTDIEEENNQVNDRFKKVKGYHAVPPPYTRNYMPSRHDISFTGLDDFVYNTNDSLEQPKDVSPSAPIIEEWESNSDDDCVIRPLIKQNKPSYAKINFVKSDENTRKMLLNKTHIGKLKTLGKVRVLRVDKRNWNGLMTQKLGDGFEFNKKACFVCRSLNHLIKDCNVYENKMVGKSVLNNMGRVTVATKSRLVPVNAAKQSSPRASASISTTRHVNTAALKPKVNDASPKIYSYFKAHLPVRKAFNQKSIAKTNNLNKKVKTTRVNNVTTIWSKAVVNAAEGKRENVVKSSTCWIWRPTRKVIEDWDAIRAKLEANAELDKRCVWKGTNHEQRFCKKSGNMKIYGEEFQTEISKKQRIEDKDVSDTEEKVSKVKEEEPVKRVVKRKKQKARKGISINKSPQGDLESNKEESVEAMNPTPLDTKSNIVANWKIFQQGERSIYQIISSKWS